MYKKIFLTITLILTTSSLVASEENIDPNEFNSLVEACMDLQAEGKLPGVSSELDPNTIFRSNSVNISTKDSNYYPLELDCIIDNKDKKYSFTFTKDSHNSDWVLTNN